MKPVSLRLLIIFLFYFIPFVLPAQSVINLALNRPVVASSSENATTLPATAAVDGNGDTRWSSQFQNDPEWLYVDLGEGATIERVKLTWEAAFATAYQIQVSNDAITWSTIRSVTNNTTLINDLTGLQATGRYLRLYGTARNTANYGYSLYELEVYGITNLAFNRPTLSSSYLDPNKPSLAVDEIGTTRWESVQGNDPEWIYVDLGTVSAISDIKLTWETAAGRDFVLQTSNNATTWTTIQTVVGNQVLENNYSGLNATGRYVRMYGTARTTQYGYSLYNFAVYGTRSQRSILPVSFTRFTASTETRGVRLQWATATETDNRGFEVQRSEDGVTFVPVAFVAGAGTTTTPQQYHYLDENTFSSLRYYRLQQIDFDGKAVYTPVVAVRGAVMGTATGNYSLYPNPATDQVTFAWSTPVPTKVVLTLVDSQGRVKMRQEYLEQSGANTLPLDLRTYAAGIYFLTLRHEQGLLHQTRISKVQ